MGKVQILFEKSTLHFRHTLTSQLSMSFTKPSRARLFSNLSLYSGDGDNEVRSIDNISHFSCLIKLPPNTGDYSCSSTPFSKLKPSKLLHLNLDYGILQLKKSDLLSGVIPTFLLHGK